MRDMKAYSIAELIIYLGIVSVLMAGVIAGGKYVFAQIEVTDTRNSMQIMSLAVTAYRSSHHGDDPDSMESLRSEGLITGKQTVDSWGTEYRFVVSGDSLLIESAGPDKKWGTGDELETKIE